jgi:ankyrin repeat protein
VVFGAEPLINAALYGKLEVVRFLVKELGADINQADEIGYTPLLVAAQKGYLAVCVCLVKELGADVHRANPEGYAPLFTAAQKGHLPVVHCLVKDLGADVDQPSDTGTTPLHIAARNGHLDVVQCLVKELGADINKAADAGVTPLMVASHHEHMEVVVWLIKHGADAQAMHQEGFAAADLSREFGAPAEQTAYLEARTHCANPGCDGAGLKKCAGCLKVFFCGPACIRAHWPAHKAECKRIAEAAAAAVAAGKAK